jgi:hypothetical protein
MLRCHARLLLVLCLAMGPCLPALAAPPSDGEVNRLLSASRAQAMLSNLLPQMEAMQAQQFAQVMANPALSAAQRQQVQAIAQRTTQTMRQSMSWSQLRPVYAEQYKLHFTREEVLAMAEFYESDAGQRMLDKTPELMNGAMAAIDARLKPQMQQLQRELEAITAPAR